LDKSLPFDPAPSRPVPPFGAESGHKEGTKFESSVTGRAAKIEAMSGRAQKVLDEALDLSDEERAEVALELVASLDGPTDPGAEAAWAAEIDRRARRVHADPDGGQDWQSARAEIESKLRRR
jgi:putative addiction module component (TIGR02574 family)